MQMSLEKGRVKNALLVAITRMGDMLQASPTISGLKQENPEARLTVLIDSNFASICHGIPGIDEIYEIDLAYVCRCLHREGEGIVDAYKYLDKVVEDLKSKDFDYCMNMSSSSYTALLLRMLNIGESRGWMSDNEGYRLISNPWAMLFAAFVYHSNRDYNSINLVDIFRCSAGVSEHPRSLVYEVADSEKDFPDKLLAENRITGTGPLICVQAGASQEKRQWAPAHFVRLIKILIDRLDARIVLTGTRSEEKIVNAVVDGVKSSNVLSSVGKTNLAQLASLLERSDLLVTGDTGPMHLSVAVGTPVVSLFLASALGFETGPYGRGNFIIQPQVSCSPCNPNFPCARPDCHTQVNPELVAHLAEISIKTPLEKLPEVSLPQSLANPAEVAVYVTAFDEDGFIDLVQVNGLSTRNGQQEWFFRGARYAYRKLWKEELRIDGSRPELELGAFPEQVGEFEFPRSNTLELLDTVAKGVATIERLIALIADVNSAPALLGECNAEIDQIDRDIENIGLRTPILGALIRMFIMEKQNMRGDNPQLLASEMKQLYLVLASRLKKFAAYYAEFYQGLSARKSYVFPTTRSPMRESEFLL